MAEIKNKQGVGSSIFWFSWMFISLLSMIFLGIWSNFAESIKGLSLTVIFSLMIVAGVLISVIASLFIPKFKVFRLGNSWLGECMSFTSLFVVFYILARISLMIKKGTGIGLFSMSGNSLFATVKTSLPLYAEIIMDTTIIPFAEEMIWMLAIPITILALLYVLSTKTRATFLKNQWLQLIIVCLISAVTFAFFHVGNITILAFIIGAMVFRTVVIVLYWGDRQVDVLPGITLYASGILGAHMGNNVAQYGLKVTINAMSQNIAGILMMGFFVIIFGSAIYFIYSRITKKSGVKAR